MFHGWRGYKDVALTELDVFRGWHGYKDVAPKELAAIDGSRSYKDFGPVEFVGECLVDQNAELTAAAGIITNSATNSLK